MLLWWLNKVVPLKHFAWRAEIDSIACFDVIVVFYVVWSVRMQANKMLEFLLKIRMFVVIARVRPL